MQPTKSLAAQAAAVEHNAAKVAHTALPAGITPEVWASLPEAVKSAMAQQQAALTAAQEAANKPLGRITLRWGIGSLDKGTAKAEPSLSVYGLSRFPVTLYREQWIRLLDAADDIRAKLAEHGTPAQAADVDLARKRKAIRDAKAS